MVEILSACIGVALVVAPLGLLVSWCVRGIAAAEVGRKR